VIYGGAPGWFTLGKLWLPSFEVVRATTVFLRDMFDETSYDPASELAIPLHNPSPPEGEGEGGSRAEVLDDQ